MSRPSAVSGEVGMNVLGIEVLRSAGM